LSFNAVRVFMAFLRGESSPRPEPGPHRLADDFESANFILNERALRFHADVAGDQGDREPRSKTSSAKTSPAIPAKARASKARQRSKPSLREKWRRLVAELKELDDREQE
jgi:hypothetical protein